MNRYKDIKVLHTEWSDGWGGQEIRIINEMLSVKKKGIDVYLACRKDAKIAQKAKEYNIPVYYLPFRGNTDIKTLLQLVKIIKSNSIDIVNTHSGKDTWVGGLSAKIAGAKFIRTRHLSNPINPSYFNFINKIADYIITTGESIRKDMIQNNNIDPKKIISIPTGINIKLFNPNEYDKNKAREYFGIDKDSFVVGNLAVLRGFKRHKDFIDIAKQLIPKYPNLKFVIAGDGPQMKNLKNQIQKSNLTDKVILLGHIYETPMFLKSLDAFMLTSNSGEGVPQSVIQALMMSLPTVATDVGSVNQLYNGNNFILTQPNDIDKMAKDLEQIIIDKQLRKQLISNARDSVIERYSMESMRDQILSVYERLLTK